MEFNAHAVYMLSYTDNNTRTPNIEQTFLADCPNALDYGFD